MDYFLAAYLIITVIPLINAGAFIDFTFLPDPATITDLRLLEACVYLRPAFIDFTIIFSKFEQDPLYVKGKGQPQ